MEIARLLKSGVPRLRSRGGKYQELALIAEAAGRSNSELAAEMDRLAPDGQTSAATQLNEALVYDGDDPDERAATAALADQAQQVRQLLVNHGLLAGTNSGIAV